MYVVVPCAGLTHLSYNLRAANGNLVAPVPQAPEGTAAALAAVMRADPQPDPPASTSLEKLKLDMRLMQVREG